MRKPLGYFQGLFAIMTKELKDYFLSPLIYIIAGMFCLLMGWLFYNSLMTASQLTTAAIGPMVLAPVFGQMNFLFLFLSPLITMRVFSEEKKMKTLDLLLASDLGHSQIVLGKFFACTLIVLFLQMLTLVFPIILSFSGHNDWGTVATSYLGVFLSSMCYLSVGLFMSSLTENQILAAIGSFCVLFCMMLFMLTASATDNFILSQMLVYFSSAFHFEGFVHGVVKTFNLVYYITFMGFFFFLTHKSLDARNW